LLDLFSLTFKNIFLVFLRGHRALLWTAAGIASAAAAASEAITTTGQCKDGRVLKADLGAVM